VHTEAGARSQLTMTAASMPVGDYVIGYRFTDTVGNVLSSTILPVTRWDPLHISTIPYYLGPKVLFAKAVIYSEGVKNSLKTVLYQLSQNDRIVFEKKVASQEAIKGVDLSTTEIVPGQYKMVAKGFDTEGEEIARFEKELLRPEDPFWFVENYGTKNFVPKPWTPVKAEKKSCSIWGRTYQFNGGFIPEQMTTFEEGLFA